MRLNEKQLIKIRRKIAWILFVSVFALTLPLQVESQEIVVMTGEWKPYVSRDLEENGFLSVVVSEAFTAAGMTPEIHFAPWPRCEAAIEYGKYPVAFPYSSNEERATFAYFSDSLAKSRSVLFYNPRKQQNFDFTGLENLKPFLIGGIRGYFYIPRLKKAGLSIDFSENEIDAMKKLLYGRVDLVALNELVGWKIIDSLYPDEKDRFASSKTALSENDLKLMVSKKHTGALEYLERFNNGLRIIKSNGTYRKILVKYRVPETIGSFE